MANLITNSTTLLMSNTTSTGIWSAAALAVPAVAGRIYNGAITILNGFSYLSFGLAIFQLVKNYNNGAPVPTEAPVVISRTELTRFLQAQEAAGQTLKEINHANIDIGKYNAAALLAITAISCSIFSAIALSIPLTLAFGTMSAISSYCAIKISSKLAPLLNSLREIETPFEGGNSKYLIFKTYINDEQSQIDPSDEENPQDTENQTVVASVANAQTAISASA